MAAAGVTQEQMMKVIGVTDPTFRKHYSDVYHEGKASGVAAVAETLYKMAVSGKVPSATFFFLKTQAKWRETPQDININQSVTHKHVDDDKLNKMAAEVIKIDEKRKKA